VPFTIPGQDFQLISAVGETCAQMATDKTGATQDADFFNPHLTTFMNVLVIVA
jgi:hypothetical protein